MESKEQLAALINEWSAEQKEIHARLDEIELRPQRMSLERRPVDARGPFLTKDQPIAPHFPGAVSTDYRPEEVRFGAMIAGLIGGREIVAQMSEPEKKAFSELTDVAGDYLLPTMIGRIWLDAVRPQCRVLSAGSVSYPMESATVRFPGWDTPLSASWRSEGGAFADAGGDFRAVTLGAHMCGAYCDISLELLLDAPNLGGISKQIETELGKALAQAVDLAALVGSGQNNEPTGLATHLTPTGFDDTPTDYSFLNDSYYRVAEGNFTPTAAILSPRTAHTLSGLQDTLHQPLRAPAPIATLPLLTTNQVPNDLGTGTDESLAFVGQWDRLVIGFRPDVTVSILKDPYTAMQSTGMVRTYAYIRADVAILNDGAFDVVSGIKA